LATPEKGTRLVFQTKARIIEMKTLQAMSDSDSDFIPPSSESDRRKNHVILAALALVLALALAFLFGRPRPQDREEQMNTGVNLIDGNFDSTLTEQDWLNAPENPVLAESESIATSSHIGKAPPQTLLSPVVFGDDPGRDSAATPGASPLPPVVAKPWLMDEASKTGSNTLPLRLAEPRGDLAGGFGLPQEGSRNEPTPWSDDSQGRAQVATPSQVDSARDNTIAPGTGDVVSVSNPPVRELTQAQAGGSNGKVDSAPPQLDTPRVPSGPEEASSFVSQARQHKRPEANPSISQGGDKEPTLNTRLLAGRPSFVLPKDKHHGMVAQSRSLITEQEMLSVLHLEPRSSPTEPKKYEPGGKGAHAALVPLEVAVTFAQALTDRLRNQGLIGTGQIARLPRRAESANLKIWHEDDVPKATTEQRPFGLIIVEENPARTAGGIPLRTDIPPGTSPLEKTGPDKPLWQRPQ